MHTHTGDWSHAGNVIEVSWGGGRDGEDGGRPAGVCGRGIDRSRVDCPSRGRGVRVLKIAWSG